MRARLALSGIAAAAALAALAVPWLAPEHPAASLALRGFFSRLCHQQPERSFLLRGAPVAVCARCLGIYCGAALGALFSTRRSTAFRLFWAALAANVLGVATETLGLHGNLLFPRFLLGAALGAAVALLIVSRPSARQSPKMAGAEPHRLRSLG